MYVPHSVIEYWEVYTVGAKGIGEEVVIPFVHTIQLEGLGRSLISFRVTFDDAAMVNVIDSVLFAMIKEQFTGVTALTNMANGTLVPSGGTWTGRIAIGDATAEGTFEVFPSGGAWEMLFGKPMLHAFGASHKYVRDTVTLQSEGVTYVLENANTPKVANAKGLREIEVAVASVSNVGEHFGGSPLRQRQAWRYPACCSADHAPPSIPELDETEPNIHPGQCTKNTPHQTASCLYSIMEICVARASKRHIRRKLQRQRQQERKLVAAALHTL